METQQPHIARKINFGLTEQGNAIFGLRIRILTELETPHVILSNGLEISDNLGVESILHTAKWLLDTWENDDQVEFILRTRSFWIIPVINVDGYIKF
jgi:hypothetical protein|mmetsp:Transcript_962/g.118  ORF Transcript_962/g.118 Transcript_962/m.118 type:complete len:97 (-) Transcript_962:552-842(-)